MATYDILYNDFNSAINYTIDSFFKVFDFPKDYQKYIRRRLAPMINGYRLNYYTHNIGKPLEEINSTYINKCCQRIYEILKPNDN